MVQAARRFPFRALKGIVPKDILPLLLNDFSSLRPQHENMPQNGQKWTEKLQN